MKPFAIEILQRFRPYVIDCVIVSALTNGTHFKVYIANKYATFQFMKKNEDNYSKGVLTLVDLKTDY